MGTRPFGGGTLDCLSVGPGAPILAHSCLLACLLAEPGLALANRLPNLTCFHLGAWPALFLVVEGVLACLLACLLAGALDRNKGREAFTTSHGVAITLKNRVSWFHRYEPVIEKAFARLWGERPEEDSFSLFLWSFGLQQRNGGVVALWFTPSHESSPYFATYVSSVLQGLCGELDSTCSWLDQSVSGQIETTPKIQPRCAYT